MNALSRLLPALCLLISVPLAQAADEPAVRRLDPALDALVHPQARLDTVYQADTVFDGATWVAHGNGGYLIFSDVPGDVIRRLDGDGRVSVLVDHIFAGKDPSEGYQSFGAGGQKKFWMIGANGTTIDPQGRVVYCAYSNGQIERLEADGRRTVLASRFGELRINAPNDLVYGPDGALYFTDSRAGTSRPDGNGVPHKGLYVLRDGRVHLLSDKIDHPNGVALSPDRKILYIANTVKKNILRYDLSAQGIDHEKVVADMSGDTQAGAPDGIKVDRRGNLYCTGPGGIWILNAAGKHLGTIQTTRQATNMAFGEGDAKTLYITSFGAVYRLRLKAAGR